MIYTSPSPEHGQRGELERVLGKIVGVQLFQEHAMRLAIIAANFTPENADQLHWVMATHLIVERLLDRSDLRNRLTEVDGGGTPDND